MTILLSEPSDVLKRAHFVEVLGGCLDNYLRSKLESPVKQALFIALGRCLGVHISNEEIYAALLYVLPEFVAGVDPIAYLQTEQLTVSPSQVGGMAFIGFMQYLQEKVANLRA